MKWFSHVLTLFFVLTCVIHVPAGQIDLNDAYNAGDPFISDNYMWIDVTETNGNPADLAFNFYQEPQTIGDTLIVNPTNFRVEINPGAGLLQIDSQLEMIIMGKNGGVIDEINFSELGDYQSFGYR